MNTSTKPRHEIAGPYAFLFAGISGMAASSICHPLNIIKNRMQLATRDGKETTVRGVVHNIINNEGLIHGMYRGLTSNLARQATYTATRIGVYYNLLDRWKNPDGSPPNLLVKVYAGCIGGILGAFVGSPAELCLIRTTTDGRLSPSSRRNYTHFGNALYRIVKEEGFLSLWRGGWLNIGRACTVNASQLATYTQAKQMFMMTQKYEDGLVLHILSSMISGLAVSIISMPIDMIKTRVQDTQTIHGIPQYKGAWDALTTIVNFEGYLALWKGFLPYYARQGPHTIITFMLWEQLTEALQKFQSKKTG